MADLFISGTLSKDFTNTVVKEEFAIKNRKQIKEGVFVGIKNPTVEGEIDTSGMSEGFIPKWCTEQVDYYNGKTAYPIKVYDENARLVSIDDLGGVIPYGSSVKVQLVKASSGYYYPKAVQILNFNDAIVDENPFK